MIIPFLQVLAKPIFGEFEKEEFKKFLRMGLIFSFIIGSYWTLRVLKDSIFMNLVSKNDIPWAKTASLVCLFPLVIFYTKLLDKLSRERMFYTLATIYGCATLIFALLLLIEKVSTNASQTRTEKAGKFQFKPPNKASSKEGIHWLLVLAVQSTARTIPCSRDCFVAVGLKAGAMKSKKYFSLSGMGLLGSEG